MSWSIDDMESQAGRTFVVTGGNAGIGFETASLLRAAIDRGVSGGDYYGPGTALTLTLYGDAGKQRSARLSRDRNIATRLWRTAEELCGERWPVSIS